MKKVAFVIPWYGSDIRGGAETECNHLAHCLKEKGIQTEVFTTCVQDAAADRGKNTLKEGIRDEDGIPVRRFKVKTRDAARFNNANEKMYYNRPFTVEDEKSYFEEDINSPDMYRYIEENKDEYSFFIFIPYLYGPTYFGVSVVPEKAVLIPCFHDEGYVYMKLIKEMVEKVRGIVFLSEPERKLADKIFDLDKIKTETLGAYVESDWVNKARPEEFRKKYNIMDEFILYAGRKDAGKKADQLVAYFSSYKKMHPLDTRKLVLIGGGSINIPHDLKDEILDLGFVSAEDKYNAYSAAYLICNPSYFESFSIVIMEGWLAKKPVLVSAHCEVTTDFCKRSNGGLYYSDYAEFCGCLDYLVEKKENARIMGENGFEFVSNNFIKSVIAEKYTRFLEKLDGGEQDGK